MHVQFTACAQIRTELFPIFPCFSFLPQRLSSDLLWCVRHHCDGQDNCYFSPNKIRGRSNSPPIATSSSSFFSKSDYSERTPPASTDQEREREREKSRREEYLLLMLSSLFSSPLCPPLDLSRTIMRIGEKIMKFGGRRHGCRK